MRATSFELASVKHRDSTDGKQELFRDGGFSFGGITDSVIEVEKENYHRLNEKQDAGPDRVGETAACFGKTWRWCEKGR